MKRPNGNIDKETGQPLGDISYFEGSKDLIEAQMNYEEGDDILWDHSQIEAEDCGAVIYSNK